MFHLCRNEDDVMIEDTEPMDDSSLDENLTWDGFRVIGDNLDKNVRPRFRRIDRGTQSLHFFHVYAAKDRVNLSNVTDSPSSFLNTPVAELPVQSLLPTSSDNQSLFSDFSVLVSRVLVSKLQYFSTTFGDIVVKHIQHEFSKEMAEKSETVSY